MDGSHCHASVTPNPLFLNHARNSCRYRIDETTFWSEWMNCKRYLRRLRRKRIERDVSLAQIRDLKSQFWHFRWILSSDTFLERKRQPSQRLSSARNPYRTCLQSSQARISCNRLLHINLIRFHQVWVVENRSISTTVQWVQNTVNLFCYPSETFVVLNVGTILKNDEPAFFMLGSFFECEDPCPNRVWPKTFSTFSDKRPQSITAQKTFSRFSDKQLKSITAQWLICFLKKKSICINSIAGCFYSISLKAHGNLRCYWRIDSSRPLDKIRFPSEQARGSLPRERAGARSSKNNSEFY